MHLLYIIPSFRVFLQAILESYYCLFVKVMWQRIIVEILRIIQGVNEYPYDIFHLPFHIVFPKPIVNDNLQGSFQGFSNPLFRRLFPNLANTTNN